MRRLWAGLLAILFIFSLCACGDDGTGKGFRLPLDNEPRQLDPQTATDPASVTVIATLFEGLTRLDAAGNVIDGAASYTVSADGLTYTFTLHESYWSTLSLRRQETAWDEPTRVVADDFLFGMQRAISPDNQSGTAAALFGIKNAEAIHKGEKKVSSLGVKVLDRSTLSITLTKPDNTFPAQLAATPFMPCNRAFFRYTAGRYGLEKEYVLSNGAFSLTSWNHNASLLLNKNDRYHAANQVAPQAIRYVQNTPDAVTALQNGSLDTAFLSTDQTHAARKAGITVLSVDDCVRQVCFNTTVLPLANTAIRTALRNAIEWRTMYDYLTTVGEPKATGYIPPDATVKGETYRAGDNAVTYTTHADSALTALHDNLKIVYPDEKTPVLPTLTLLAANDDTSANIARYLVQSWQKNLHIYCAMELVDTATLNTRIATGDYQIALHTAIGGGLTAADNLTAYTTGNGANHTKYSDAAFDTLCTAATNRADIVAAEQYLHNTCPSIPLSFPHRYYGIATTIDDMIVRPFNGGTYGGAYDCTHAKKFED